MRMASLLDNHPLWSDLLVLRIIDNSNIGSLWLIFGIYQKGRGQLNVKRLVSLDQLLCIAVNGLIRNIGPFPAEQLQLWRKSGFFGGPACENVELRVAGDETASWGSWADIVGA